jgi:hypothetical protein
MIDYSKIASICDWPVPSNLKELRGFLGLSGYYRKFIKHYVIISQPLTALLKKGALFLWSDDAAVAFNTLKHALILAPVIKIETKTRNERHRFLRGNPYGKNHGRTKAYFHYDRGVLQARDDRSYLVRLLGYIYEGNIQESLEDKKMRYTRMRRPAYIKPINKIWITLQQSPP